MKSTLRKELIKLAHDNPGEIRDALRPLLKRAASGRKMASDPHEQARILAEDQSGFFRELDKHLHALRKGFSEAEKQIKGLDRVGSGTIEAPAVLRANVWGPINDLANWATEVRSYTKTVLNQTNQRVAAQLGNQKKQAGPVVTNKSE
jgi:hypothetical protein